MAIVKTLCNDGNYDSSNTEETGRQDMPCRRNGGVNLKAQQNEYTNMQEAFIKNTQQQSEPFLKNGKNQLLLLLVAVAGYFAYKKFKK